MTPRRKLWIELAFWVVIVLGLLVNLGFTTDEWDNFPHWQIATWLDFLALMYALYNAKDRWAKL
jgi:hypothetical protein